MAALLEQFDSTSRTVQGMRLRLALVRASQNGPGSSQTGAIVQIRRPVANQTAEFNFN
jgi:hypothetical protein